MSGLSAELRGQRQQLGHIFGVMGGGAAALQQGAADHGAAVLRLQRLALIEGSRPAKAEHSVADGVIRTILQGFGKVHQGGGHQLHVLGGQKHAVHACGQLPAQPVHQPELAVELVSQGGFQGRAAGRCADQQIGALGVAVLLQGQLTLLQGGAVLLYMAVPPFRFSVSTVEQAHQAADGSSELPAFTGKHAFQRGLVGSAPGLQIGVFLVQLCDLLLQGGHRLLLGCGILLQLLDMLFFAVLAQLELLHALQHGPEQKGSSVRVSSGK